MRALVVLIAIIVCNPAFGSQIREFDVKTVSRLGAQLARLNDTSERGATSPTRKRGRDTAVTALKGKLFDIPYKYVVLDDQTVVASSFMRSHTPRRKSSSAVSFA